MTDYTEQAREIVKLVRAYTTTEDEAVELVDQACRAAHSGGALEALQQDAERMAGILNTVVGGPQTEAVKRLAKAGA